MPAPTSAIRTRRSALGAIWTDQELAHAWRWFGLSALVGLLGGLAAIVFYYASAALGAVALEWGAGYVAGGPKREPTVLEELATGGGVILVALILLPAVGNLLAGLIARKWAPEAAGGGEGNVIHAYHNERGTIPLRTTVAKLVCSVLTLGTGGSGGREGPMSQIGAGLGSWLGRVFKLTAADRRVLLAAGAAAGIGAIFRAPLASALFAAEVMYRRSEFESEALVPSMISSIIGYCVFSAVTGEFNPLFELSDTSIYAFSDPRALLPYLILGVVVTLGGLLFVKLKALVRWAHDRMPVPEWLKPGIGGALAGLVAVALFLLAGSMLVGNVGNHPVTNAMLAVLSFGYGLLQGLLNPEYAAELNLLHFTSDFGPRTGTVVAVVLLLVAVGKSLTTALTIETGGSAGWFGPSMVIGGCLGGAVGQYFVGWNMHPEPFVVLGMAGFFAGVGKVPISTVIMVCELTGSYELLIPAMWVCAISYLALGRRGALYSEQPLTRSESAAHRGDFLVDIFRGMTVSELVPRRLDTAHPVNAKLTLSQFVPEIIQTHHTYFPVVDDDDRLVGIFSLNDIREVLYDEALGHLVTAADVATTRVVRLRLNDPLNDALARFSTKGFEFLPVVDDTGEEEEKLLGMLSRRAVLAEYTDRLHALKQVDPELSGRSRKIEKKDLV